MLKTEQFIHEVKCRPCLWRTDRESHNDKYVKIHAWHEIALAMYPDWHSFNNNERQAKVFELQKKWKHIRDYYVRQKRCRNKSKGKIKMKKYVFFDLLTFLDSTPIKRGNATVEKRPKATGSSRNVEPVKAQPPPAAAATGGDAQSRRNEKLKQMRRRRMLFRLQAELRNRQRLLPSKDDIDEDETFLFSLLPSMARLSGLQKLDFKIEVMKALKKIEYQSACGGPYNAAFVAQEYAEEQNSLSRCYSPELISANYRNAMVPSNEDSNFIVEDIKIDITG